MKIHRGGQYPQSTPMQKLSQIHSHRLSCFSRPGECTACQLPTGPEMGRRKCHHPDSRRNPRGRTAVWSLAFVHSSVHAATRHTQPLCLRPFIAPSDLQDVIRLFVYLPVSLYISNRPGNHPVIYLPPDNLPSLSNHPAHIVSMHSCLVGARSSLPLYSPEPRELPSETVGSDSCR